MRVTKDKLPHAKSYPSMYDLFSSTPLNNSLYKNARTSGKHFSSFQVTSGDAVQAKRESSNLIRVNSTEYITSEKYHLLNREHSYKSVIRSTSTLFYDLDDVAKRHSFHCTHDTSLSNVNLLKVMKVALNTNGFNGKSNAIVQECATQIQPKLLPRDSIETNLKKIRKDSLKDSFESSEIFLRDNVYYDENNKRYYDREITDRQQKFWSFAKYRTEYTNPIPEEKKRKKKDRGKRTEDPCPCQLFSYACPCTVNKSLTELAKNSKSLTVTDQITSTTKYIGGDEIKEVKNKHCNKKGKKQPTMENQLLNTDFAGVVGKFEVIPANTEQLINIPVQQHIPSLTHSIKKDSVGNKSKTKSSKKHRKIKCPKCKEHVEVELSTTDEEESLKRSHSSRCHCNESITSKTGLKSPKSNRHKSLIAEDNCEHEPQCELIPVCQILPTDTVYLSQRCTRKQSHQKTTPKLIRITKACRHHPPCTVVPSCQKANVLKNNCEFIPPCLHRPRCVNLPLCVPVKNLHYEEQMRHYDDEGSECPHIPRCKYVPECQYDPVINHLDNRHNIVSQVQNACEFVNDFQQPNYSVSPKMTECPQNTTSLKKVVSPILCRSNKSCQHDCTDCKCAHGSADKDIDGNEAVIFIRDVGCQFRNKLYYPKEYKSDHSKVSSTSLDYVDVKMGNYYTNVHTLRCEDKYTTPMADELLSDLSVSIISLEVDSHCPTHGGKASHKHSERATGFVPKQNTSPYVAYATQRSPMIPSQMYSGHNELNDSRLLGQGYARTFPVKSRRSFLKGKYKKMFAVKRRRKSRVSSRGFSSHSTNKISV